MGIEEKFPVCGKCLGVFTDVEIFAAVGRTQGAKALGMIEKVVNKEAEKRKDSVGSGHKKG